MNSKIVFHDLKIEIADKTGFIVYYYGELMYIIYDAPYCWFYFADKTKYKIETTVQYLFDNLPEVFFRCNRSSIINISYYKKFLINMNKLVMDDGKIFTLSRNNAIKFNTKRISLPRITPPCLNCYSCKIECESMLAFCLKKKRNIKL